jgi:hypothetical protein
VWAFEIPSKFAVLYPYIMVMPSSKLKPKTKAELREMLAEAVRNTQPKTEPKPLPKAKKVHR